MINQVSIEASQGLWNLLLSQNNPQVPFLTWKWHTIWFQTLGKEFRPLTLVVDNTIISSFAVKDTTLFFAGGDEIADYIDIIGKDKCKRPAWEQILPFCKTLGITQCSFHNIPENSSTRIFFESTPNSSVEKEDTTPNFELPNSWEHFVESLGKRYTHELERKMRKFDREHPDSQVGESENPEADLPILLQLMEKDVIKKEFLTPDMKHFFREIVSAFASDISLRYISVGDKKIAATLSFIMDNTYYLYNSGFDKDCCSLAGFFLKALNIKWAIEKKARSYNFLQGNERYKYELGGKDFGVYKILHQIT